MFMKKKIERNKRTEIIIVIFVFKIIMKGK